MPFQATEAMAAENRGDRVIREKPAEQLAPLVSQPLDPGFRLRRSVTGHSSQPLVPSFRTIIAGDGRDPPDLR